MIDYDEMLDLAKKTVTEASQMISTSKSEIKIINEVTLCGKETKIIADQILDNIIIKRLGQTGINILSEESGYIQHHNQKFNQLQWIVDPLDGSINYSRNSGPSAISVALWNDMTPIFGVIYLLNEKTMVWGGEKYGSWMGGGKITTSKIVDKNNAILCTGLPARFDHTNSETIEKFNKNIFDFSKIRMIGSAACSLVMVATGSVDAYWEEDIMLWDVAAGLPIVKGANGKTKCVIKKTPFQCSVYASNNCVMDEII